MLWRFLSIIGFVKDVVRNAFCFTKVFYRKGAKTQRKNVQYLRLGVIAVISIA
jgi:hypothetical protein